MNIGSLLNQRAIMMGDKIGFVHGDLKITFEEMNNRANSFSNYLLELGLQPGDTMAIVCKNNEQAIAAFFGASKVGVLSIMVNWRLAKEEMNYILTHCDAKLVVYDEAFQPVIEGLKETIPAIHFLSGTTTPSFATIWQQKSSEPSYVSAEEDPILVVYTSGTTGKPKGALLSHNNLLAASIGLSHTIDWWETDRFLMIAPFFHIGGLAPLITNVHTGATLVLMEDFDPIAAWKVIESERITTMMTVPLMLTYFLKTYPVVKPDISSLRNITCGSSVVPVPLILGFRELGIPVQQVYGITEYTGAVTFWKETQNPNKYDSMGKSVMHGEVRVVDLETRETLPNGELGEIIIGGPQVFVGYYKNEEAYKSAVVDGEFQSGDIGYIDGSGYLYVVDRLKDMIISGGENIYSAELEHVLAQHPAVVDVAVVGVLNEKWGEVPRAFVVKDPNAELSEEDLLNFSKEKLAAYKTIKEVVFVDELPRNAVGKILKNQLKELSLA